MNHCPDRRVIIEFFCTFLKPNTCLKSNYNYPLKLLYLTCILIYSPNYGFPPNYWLNRIDNWEMNPPTIMLIAAIAINIFQLAFFTSNSLYHHIIFITKKVSYCKSTSKTWNLLDESNRTSLALTFFSSTTHIAVLRAASAREREWESVLQKNERERERERE